jgi:protein-L-isoaspartate(D-aspartate) O-methyltransferase
MPDYSDERRRMVENQIRKRGISDARVLAAFERVPRHRFLPDPSDGGAYSDHPLPIGSGQTISQPYMVAAMTASLRVQGGERVLEIGTGSGYQAAILAEIGCRVTSVERIPELAERARAVLGELGYTGIDVVVGDGSRGYPDAAPYDRVIVTAAAPKIAEPWVEQLAEGGRLVVPVGGRWGQDLTIITKQNGEIQKETAGGCVFVPLVGEHGWEDE